MTVILFTSLVCNTQCNDLMFSLKKKKKKKKKKNNNKKKQEEQQQHQQLILITAYFRNIIMTKATSKQYYWSSESLDIERAVSIQNYCLLFCILLGGPNQIMTDDA